MEKAQILVVDDNKTNLQLIGATLKQNNFAIAFALNAKQAEEFVAKKKPDLILLDVMMPGVDGFEYCKKFKSDKDNADIPVIFVSAKTAKIDVIKGFEVGAVDYIEKPFNGAELIKRIETHLELKKTKEEIIATNNAKNKLFSILAHDLRGPLGSVISILNILQDEETETTKEEISELLGMLQQTADSVYQLLENLLSWAQSQTGRITPNLEDTQLSGCITSIAHLYLGQANAKGITLVTNNIIGNKFAVCDTRLIRTILRNLIGNAIKFTPEHGTITISSDIDATSYHIHVKDSGLGIDSATIAKIMDKNNHFSKHGTNNEHGTGLGLNICQEFAMLNNGKISVQSEIGKGSTFSLSIPLSTNI